MACGRVTFVTIFLICAFFFVNAQKKVIELNEDNWSQMLENEWMVEFFAPWCPACKGLQPVWKDFATWSKDLGIKVAQVDVTHSPGLSGRFMVTALPTIFHVLNGEFRQYKGTRDKDSFISFIEEKKWMNVEPVPSWKSPNTVQMSVVSAFFKLSHMLRQIHNQLLEDFGLPSWLSYLIFAVGTIILGAILGLLLVCILDFFYPPKYAQEKKTDNNRSPTSKGDKDSDDELADEDIKDDLLDDGSQAEDEGKSTDSEPEVTNRSNPSSPNVKKRKARKAD